MSTLISLPHAAVEAGLGTLGLNQQLLTPEFGPRVVLIAVLASLDVKPDERRSQSSCHGPSCGRCLSVCPGDAVRHWARDWEACDAHRSPYGFAKLTDHIEAIIRAPDAKTKKDMLRTEAMFNLWQSILRGSVSSPAVGAAPTSVPLAMIIRPCWQTRLRLCQKTRRLSSYVWQT